MRDIPNPPPVRPGWVILGMGGSFKRLPRGKKFVGYTWCPQWPEGEGWTQIPMTCTGGVTNLMYCARADSEIVKLNGLSEQSVQVVDRNAEGILEAENKRLIRALKEIAFHEVNHDMSYQDRVYAMIRIAAGAIKGNELE